MRTYKKVRKHKTPAQLENLTKAQAARVGRKMDMDKENIPISVTQHKLDQVKSKLSFQQTETSILKKKLINMQRKNVRNQNAKDLLKTEVKKAKNTILHLELQKNVAEEHAKRVEETTSVLLQSYQARLNQANSEKSEVVRRNKALKNRIRRLESIKKVVQERAYRAALRKGTIFRLKHRGVYSPAARAISRYLVLKGTPEKHVGTVIQEIGSLMGVCVKEKMSTSTVRRTSVEGGVIADIQWGYDMAWTEGMVNTPKALQISDQA